MVERYVKVEMDGRVTARQDVDEPDRPSGAAIVMAIEDLPAALASGAAWLNVPGQSPVDAGWRWTGEVFAP